MLSQNESQGLSNMGEQQELEVFGLHFCPICKNLMRPYSANGHILDFQCERCNRKHPVDFSRKSGEECLLYSKELQVGSRKYVPENDYIFDPTMPRVAVECPECGHGTAVYMLTPDEGETKLLAMMICASATGTQAKCGHSWMLEETSDLLETMVLIDDEKPKLPQQLNSVSSNV